MDIEIDISTITIETHRLFFMLLLLSSLREFKGLQNIELIERDAAK